MVRNRVLRTGDGSHKYNKLAAEDPEFACENNNGVVRDTEHFWGWGEMTLSSLLIQLLNNLLLLSSGDKAMTEDDLKNVEILHKELD